MLTWKLRQHRSPCASSETNQKADWSENQVDDRRDPGSFPKYSPCSPNSLSLWNAWIRETLEVSNDCNIFPVSAQEFTCFMLHFCDSIFYETRANFENTELAQTLRTLNSHKPWEPWTRTNPGNPELAQTLNLWELNSKLARALEFSSKLLCKLAEVHGLSRLSATNTRNVCNSRVCNNVCY